ncbi:MAG: SOS response-associated peptidase [Syntrophaceae bacterium]|nr:SOS response-associated peptidase [Syntrophaceae bacterium]
MCGRFVLVTDLKNIRKNFNIQEVFCQYQPGWNIAPGQLIPAIINHEGKNLLVCFRWGMIPSWSKDPSIAAKMFNARAETVDQKPSFRDAFKKRRCLIVADGFYEWKKEGPKKMPLYYYLKSGQPFGFAGLYETWLSPDKKEINTCTIITTAANELIAPVHDRMPVILSPEREKIWLESNAADVAALKSILKLYPAEEMDSRTGIGPHNDIDYKSELS